MSDEKRGAPWVGWMQTVCAVGGHTTECSVAHEAGPRHTVPVTVVPMLADDPKIGETWIEDGEREVKILGPVTVDCEGIAWVETSNGICDLLCLTRPPVLKTYRINAGASSGLPYFRADVRVDAESREAAIARLAEALEEVKP